MSICSSGEGGKCFDRNALIEIADAINRKERAQRISLKKSRNALWNEIRNYFAGSCSSRDGNVELCWAKKVKQFSGSQNGGNSEKNLDMYFKPSGPANRRTPLYTSDIDNALKRLEVKYPNFLFMGAVPIDFDRVIRSYSNINICKLNRSGKSKVGFVFNLDKSTQDGSHWVCAFLDIANRYIGFIDSYGMCPPEPQIQKFISRLQQQAKQCIGIDLTVKCSTTEHQQLNTECGMYCVYFITQLVKGRSWDNVTRTITRDKVVAEFRKKVFRTR